MVNKRLKPPVFRWVTQDYNGVIAWHQNEPVKRSAYWSSEGKPVLDLSIETHFNTEWTNTKIDLEAVKRGEYDYEFTSGILRKIPAKERRK